MKVFINATSARLGGGITAIRNLSPALALEDRGRRPMTLALFEELL